MENTAISLTTVALFAPLVGMFVLFFIPRAREEAIRWVALGTTLVTFILTILLALAMDHANPDLQLVTFYNWVPAWGISYYVGVDGLSILLVLLTSFIMPAAILVSWDSIKDRVKLYYVFMLLLEFAMIGVFVAQDLFLFYIFWEVTLVPMYFLIGIWGAENRVYAAVKFFLYTMAGSLLMLIAILFLGNMGGTFALPELIAQVRNGTLVYPAGAEMLLFAGFAIAFAIKVPMWPLHSWLPDAHVQAPTAGSVILAGVLLKMGTYGFVRFNLPLFPQASVQAAPLIAVLAVIGIIYGAWVSYAQKDAKKLVAYSSVSHLGFVMLGIFALNAAGISGGILQMVNHGISTGGLFILVGILYERRHTKALDAFGGVWKALPLFGGLSLIIVLSSMGLPGMNGFVGEFTILLGSFGSPVLGFFFTFFAAFGVIMAAVYLLYMFQKIFMGPLDKPENEALAAQPLTWKELVALAPLIVMIFWIGLFPQMFFGMMSSSVSELVAQVGPFVQMVAGGG
ncbi:MAG: NADH-quinone oxidoreductase subunit M [Anaerolineae bacterium]|nr:NADH-quinone oxidoreductase subunit M [Anaerolineae bacterium]